MACSLCGSEEHTRFKCPDKLLILSRPYMNRPESAWHDRVHAMLDGILADRQWVTLGDARVLAVVRRAGRA
jgi:hypothetical protein